MSVTTAFRGRLGGRETRRRELAVRHAFTAAMRAHASSVVIVTCRVDGRPWGTTVTSFASVSADPPTVFVSLDSETAAAGAIEAAGRFGVSVLAADQVAIARYAAVPGEAKFLERFAEPDDVRVVIGDALAHLDCEVDEALRVADHTVFFGRVVAAGSSLDRSPLVHQRRRYRTLTERSTTWPTS